MEFTTNSGFVRTRFFILSDTHGIEFGREERSFHHADVAIHCGNLTEESKLEEYRASLRLLMDIQAPLKLVIAGNHDFTMDIAAFRKKVANARPPLDPGLVRKVYGDFGEARQLFEDARSAGIIFLDEGSHRFTLENGAILAIYASPYTPSLGDWGFQYHPSQGHDFEITKGVDLVITHGPPKGIMDYTESKQRAGCPDLFGAIARARPRLHCFGHIHEGWGARMVTWREQLTEKPSHFTDIDNDKSITVEKLSGFKHSKSDTRESKDEKSEKERYHRQQRCYATTHCIGDANPLKYGAQTLFINAAIQGTEEKPLQLPWLEKSSFQRPLEPYDSKLLHDLPLLKPSCQALYTNSQLFLRGTINTRTDPTGKGILFRSGWRLQTCTYKAIRSVLMTMTLLAIIKLFWHGRQLLLVKLTVKKVRERIFRLPNGMAYGRFASGNILAKMLPRAPSVLPLAPLVLP